MCIRDRRYTDRSKEELLERVRIVDDRRIYVIAELIRKGASYDEIHDITKIDKWFIDKIAILVEMEQRLKNEKLTPELLAEAKRIEFPDNVCLLYTSGRRWTSSGQKSISMDREDETFDTGCVPDLAATSS